MPGESITCRRCARRAVDEREDDITLVPAGWKRVVVLTAGEGTRLAADDLDAYSPTDGYWVCPAHQ